MSKFCTFCLNVGKLTRKECSGHQSGDPNCPTLMKTTCLLCGKKGHLKRNCKEPFCHFCRKAGKDRLDCVGHTVGKDCPTLAQAVCGKCQKQGHTAKFCQTDFCYFCKVLGHSITECEEKNKLYCIFCGENGHTKSYCRSPYRRQNRKLYH